MSLAVFPFKDEAPALILANLATAAEHPAIDEVWAVAAEEGPSQQTVGEGAAGLARAANKPVRVLVQERIGRFRPGKGDGMNTAIALAARSGWERAHFYDADITNFDAGWIDGAEQAVDRGYGVVRHRFPRASTDAMITWMITRPSLALLFPGTFLPALDQPLGGELLLTGEALESLSASALVRDRSDWGIDTVITYATSVMGLGLYEHHVADGKRHALYGSLDELRDMVLECLDAASSLQGRPGPPPDAAHAGDAPSPVPPDLKRTVAYDIDSSIGLLSTPLSEDEAELAGRLPGGIGRLIVEQPSTLDFSFLGAEPWGEVLGMLLDEHVLGDVAWDSLAFRLWLTRVLAYTTDQARAGYDEAMAYLEGTIEAYERGAARS